MTVRRFRKRPVDGDLVDAIAFDGAFPLEFLRDDEQVRAAKDGSGAAVIQTRNGTQKAAAVNIGDWLLRHHDGGVSVCKSDVFEATYEPTGAEH